MKATKLHTDRIKGKDIRKWCELRKFTREVMYPKMQEVSDYMRKIYYS